jgi:hypothetical protein
MRIYLINQEQYNEIFNIFKFYPKLTLQNEGYQYLNKAKFDDEDKKAFDLVESILKKSIVGFTKFHNFRVLNNKLQLRFDYNWNYDDPNGLYFVGVGYLYLNELFKGFDNY